jgi:hypothetical protein
MAKREFTSGYGEVNIFVETTISSRGTPTARSTLPSSVSALPAE